MRTNALFLVAVSAALLPAQQPNTVSVTVSTTQPLAAGSAVIRMTFAEASLTSTLDNALGVLTETGAAASNLVDNTVFVNQGFVVASYEFSVPVPPAQANTVRDRLIAIQRSLPTTRSVGWEISFRPDAAAIAQARTAALAGLLSEARQQAAPLAEAMGKSLGEVQSISAVTTTVTGLNLELNLTVTLAVQ